MQCLNRGEYARLRLQLPPLTEGRGDVDYLSIANRLDVLGDRDAAIAQLADEEGDASPHCRAHNHVPVHVDISKGKGRGGRSSLPIGYGGDNTVKVLLRQDGEDYNQIPDGEGLIPDQEAIQVRA